LVKHRAKLKWAIDNLESAELHGEERKRHLLELASASGLRLSKAFTDWTAEEVRARFGLYSTQFADAALPSQFEDVVLCTPAIIPEARLNRLVEELEDRRVVLLRGFHDFQPLNEATKREVISPFLIAAASLTNDVIHRCEFDLFGQEANGPVDYASQVRTAQGAKVVWDNLVVTEAKKADLNEGLQQNFLQLEAAFEAISSSRADAGLAPKPFRPDW